MSTMMTPDEFFQQHSEEYEDEFMKENGYSEITEYEDEEFYRFVEQKYNDLKSDYYDFKYQEYKERDI